MTTQNQPLQAGELTEWIALRRVCAGGVALLGSRYLDLGRPVPGYLDGPLAELHGAGLVALADVDRWLLRRVVPTRTGRARYGELSAKRRAPDDPPVGRLLPAVQPGQCLDRPLPDDHCPDRRPVEAGEV